jgi:hypothetical protein
MNPTMAIITKIIMSHIAIFMENPAIPGAPRIQATRANVMNSTARCRGLM